MEKTNRATEINSLIDGEKQFSLTQFTYGFFKFGKEIKVSPKSRACFNKAGYNIHYYVDSISLTIGIGNDHTAELSMTKDAWNALRDGAKVSCETNHKLNN